MVGVDDAPLGRSMRIATRDPAIIKMATNTTTNVFFPLQRSVIAFGWSRESTAYDSFGLSLRLSESSALDEVQPTRERW